MRVLRGVFPESPVELAAMCACYALTALLCWMVVFPRQFLHVIGVSL
jgi:hypothetical protein